MICFLCCFSEKWKNIFGIQGQKKYFWSITDHQHQNSLKKKILGVLTTAQLFPNHM